MADPEKLRALTDSLKEHEVELEELRRKYLPHSESDQPKPIDERTAAKHEAIVTAIKLLRSAIEVLGDIGL